MDLISRQAAIDALYHVDEHNGRSVEAIRNLPSAQPYTEEEIQAMQDLEQAQLDKAYQIGVEEGLRSAQPQWIPCSERLPKEHDSIFAKLYGTEKWRNAMFRKTSNTVIITVEFKDGTRQTAPCHTIDGEWNQSIKGMGNVVAWMPLPEPWKGEER